MPNPMTAGLRPAHPGELLREVVLPAVPLSKAEIARRLRMSRQQLHDILAERKPVTTATALKLARLLGGEAETWLRMQQNYDLRTVEQTLARELDEIKLFEAA